MLVGDRAQCPVFPSISKTLAIAAKNYRETDIKVS